MFRTALVALDLLDVLPIKRPLLQCLPDLKNWGIGKIMLAHVIHDPHGPTHWERRTNRTILALIVPISPRSTAS